MASVLAEIKKDWEEQKKTMSTIADAMPEDKFDFKATPAERSYGEQVLHIAQVNLFLLKVVGGKATPPAFAPKNSEIRRPISSRPHERHLRLRIDATRASRRTRA